MDVALLLGAFPRLKGMERKDLLAKNNDIFRTTGKAIDQVAKKTVKVVVVGKSLFECDSWHDCSAWFFFSCRGSKFKNCVKIWKKYERSDIPINHNI